MNYRAVCAELLAERSTLKAENAELLAALESLLDATERNVLHVDAINARVKAREAAREAIKNIKQQPTAVMVEEYDEEPKSMSEQIVHAQNTKTNEQ